MIWCIELFIRVNKGIGYMNKNEMEIRPEEHTNWDAITQLTQAADDLVGDMRGRTGGNWLHKLLFELLL
ncbi:hypothetical protein QNI19_16610 [Cytophagaceae bacterium DM2B3-1]|uniref:Uncharacterized protein n=1 Tax=Xanthocytophaga flava TaxID=3048013 RepID=A0ABT7CLE3_9BACT|nr:hypothetical protein [Xanthocytophaga flavus]MDJ1468202.1 hypothetical protein [Xanthocytophaga flavus]MDJ1494569.1 hypothetical protein [Xanthocytophaga flavus]